MEHLLRVRGKIRTPRLLQRPDVEEADSAEVLDNGVGVVLPFTEQIRLVLADVIRPKLVGRTVEVARKLVNGSGIKATFNLPPTHFGPVTKNGRAKSLKPVPASTPI